MIKKFSQQR